MYEGMVLCRLIKWIRKSESPNEGRCQQCDAAGSLKGRAVRKKCDESASPNEEAHFRVLQYTTV